MTTSGFVRPTAKTFPIDDLVQSMLAGEVRVPEFQRPLRWRWPDVQRLFESIERGYPIGSLLLWSRPAPATTVELGGLRVRAPEMQEALWVVDGQQRLTSLANALGDARQTDPRFALSYNLHRVKFERPARADDGVRIPLPILFDYRQLLTWFKDHPESERFFDAAVAMSKTLREYTVPAYIVAHEDERVLREIFDRVNNSGRRLTRTDVFNALHAGLQGSGTPLSTRDIADHVDAVSDFGRPDESAVLQAVFARSGPDVTRDVRAEYGPSRATREFPGESAEEAALAGQQALLAAVGFLQEVAHVPVLALLPYKYLLVVLARFFAHFPSPSPRTQVLLRRWYWRAAVLGPTITDGSYTSAVRKLARCVVPEDEVGSIVRLLDSVSAYSIDFALPEFKVTTARIRLALCALWDLGPRSCKAPAPYVPYVQSDLRHAIGDSTTVSPALALVHSGASEASQHIGARTFLLRDETLEDLETTLNDAGADADAREVLRTHLIDEGLRDLWLAGRADVFIESRDRKIQELTRGFLERMVEPDQEDTPPLASFDFDALEP